MCSMIKYSRLFLFVLLCFTLNSCSAVKNGEPSIKQGVFGKVLWLEGNFMPSLGKPNQKTITPAVRTVYIYRLTKLSETEGELPLFSKINNVLVAKVKTNKEGFFQRKLPPGKYSIFTLEDNGKFFASLSDGDGNIAPFEVKPGEVARYDVNINYKAAY